MDCGEIYKVPSELGLPRYTVYMDSDAPPSYRAQAPTETPGDALPPNYSFPLTFSIGQNRTSAPLVTSNQLKGHLALLHSFALLQFQIENASPDILSPEVYKLDKDLRWIWFVGIAVDR